MASESTDRVCARCTRRDRDDGGNGSCPFPRWLRDPFAAGERDCPYFQLGDRRPAPLKPIAQTGLW